MSDQPEALRLAKALAYSDNSVASQAAAELRRLHSVNVEMADALQALDDVGALEDGLLGNHGGIPEAQAKARTALRKRLESSNAS